MGELLATYRLLTGGERDVRSEVEAFATGQSVGTWLPLPGMTPELVARHGAHVVALSEPRPLQEAGPGETGRFVDATIAFPTINFEPSFAMLWTTVLGNDPSTGITATLVSLELPGSLTAAFGGPRVGIGEWRRRIDCFDRPLLLNPMKPSTGLAPAQTALLAAAVARGGMDLVKDDEVLANTSFSTVRARTEAVRAAVDEVAEQTGHRARYIVSITDRQARMAEHVAAALEAGADGLMVAALGIGLDALQELAELVSGRLPIVAHTAGIDAWSGRTGLSIAPELTVELCRLAGADAVLIGSPWARRATEMDTWRAMARRLRQPRPGVEPAFPVVGGGVVAEQLAGIVAELGSEAIITAGGSVNGHPDGAEAGARDLRAELERVIAAAPDRVPVTAADG